MTELVFFGSPVLFRGCYGYYCVYYEHVSRQLLIHNQKMEFTKFEIGVLPKHDWKHDYKAAAASRRICEVEGVVSERVAQRRFQRFNTAEENNKDVPRCEIPKLWDIKNICRVLEENPQKSTRSCQKNLMHQKIPYIARLTLVNSYRSCRSVPHELTPQQAQHRADMCLQLIGIPWMIDLSGELSRVMKKGLLLQPRCLETVARSSSTCQILCSVPK